VYGGKLLPIKKKMVLSGEKCGGGGGEAKICVGRQKTRSGCLMHFRVPLKFREYLEENSD
jgi:hypothetical protein